MATADHGSRRVQEHQNGNQAGQVVYMNTAPAVVYPVADSPISDIQSGIKERLSSANEGPATYPCLHRLWDKLQRKGVSKQFAVFMRALNVWPEYLKECVNELV